MSTRPVIAITLGDPCGIGPEVVAKALSHQEIHDICIPVVVGSIAAMEQGNRIANTSLDIRKVESISLVKSVPGEISVIDTSGVPLDSIKMGEISAYAGRASVEWIKNAAQLCLDGKVDGMATAPIHKEAAILAGYKEVGHMEILQAMTQSPQVATMLISGNLRVVHLTTHRPLSEAANAVTKENVLAKIILTNDSFKQWGFKSVHIGVAALNPHASDGGLLGSEESEAIEPAVKKAVAQGINAIGPIPADTIFHQAIKGDYDVVLAMYHDQGHIPVKVYGFEQSISVNLGLPLTRTSVDHGTAFDIAGKGIAQATSMIEAIRLAASITSGNGMI